MVYETGRQRDHLRIGEGLGDQQIGDGLSARPLSTTAQASLSIHYSHSLQAGAPGAVDELGSIGQPADPRQDPILACNPARPLTKQI